MPIDTHHLEAVSREFQLGPNGTRVLAALIADPTMTGREIARLTGLSSPTVSRWLRRPALRRALVRAQGWRAISHLPSIASALTSRALSGDSGSLLLMLRLTGMVPLTDGDSEYPARRR